MKGRKNDFHRSDITSHSSEISKAYKKIRLVRYGRRTGNTDTSAALDDDPDLIAEESRRIASEIKSQIRRSARLSHTHERNWLEPQLSLGSSSKTPIRKIIPDTKGLPPGKKVYLVDFAKFKPTKMKEVYPMPSKQILSRIADRTSAKVFLRDSVSKFTNKYNKAKDFQLVKGRQLASPTREVRADEEVVEDYLKLDSDFERFKQLGRYLLKENEPRKEKKKIMDCANRLTTKGFRSPHSIHRNEARHNALENLISDCNSLYHSVDDLWEEINDIEEDETEVFQGLMNDTRTITGKAAGTSTEKSSHDRHRVVSPSVPDEEIVRETVSPLSEGSDSDGGISPILEEALGDKTRPRYPFRTAKTPKPLLTEQNHSADNSLNQNLSHQLSEPQFMIPDSPRRDIIIQKTIPIQKTMQANFLLAPRRVKGRGKTHIGRTTSHPSLLTTAEEARAKKPLREKSPQERQKSSQKKCSARVHGKRDISKAYTMRHGPNDEVSLSIMTDVSIFSPTSGKSVKTTGATPLAASRRSHFNPIHGPKTTTARIDSGSVTQFSKSFDFNKSVDRRETKTPLAKRPELLELQKNSKSTQWLEGRRRRNEESKKISFRFLKDLESKVKELNARDPSRALQLSTEKIENLKQRKQIQNLIQKTRKTVLKPLKGRDNQKSKLFMTE